MPFSVFVQIHRLLMANKRARRYTPPTMKRVTTDSVLIHAFSIIMATFTVIPVDVFPRATPSSGCMAYTEPGNLAQIVFYWVFFMPVTALIPIILLTLLYFHIRWKDLLPRQNDKSRSLLVYFARLLASVFLVIGICIALVISYAFTPWFQAIAFVIFNLIGFFQVILALSKEDIRNAFLETWCCRKRGNGSTTTTTTSHEHQEEVKASKSSSFKALTLFQSRMQSNRANGATFHGDDEENKIITDENEVDSGEVAKEDDTDVEANESVRNEVVDEVDAAAK